MQVVSQVNGKESTSRTGVNTHVVGGVVEELGARVSLNVMGVVVTPSELHVDPVFGGDGAIVGVSLLVDERGTRDLPLELGEEEDVGTGRVHLVRFTWMNCLLLHMLDLERVKLHIEYLAKVHHYRLVDLLPQMGPEDLDQRDLKRRNLTMHENSSQIQLHLEADINVGAVDGW